jgi:hypothetical protein
MEANVHYSNEELAEMTVFAYHSSNAALIVLSSLLYDITDALSRLEKPLNPEEAAKLAASFRQRLIAGHKHEFLNQLSEDAKISAALRAKLKDGLGV